VFRNTTIEISSSDDEWDLERDLPLPRDEEPGLRRIPNDPPQEPEEDEDRQGVDSDFDLDLPPPDLPPDATREWFQGREAAWWDGPKRVAYDVLVRPARLRPRAPPDEPSPEVEEALAAADEAQDDVLAPLPREEEPLINNMSDIDDVESDIDIGNEPPDVEEGLFPHALENNEPSDVEQGLFPDALEGEDNDDDVDYLDAADPFFGVGEGRYEYVDGQFVWYPEAAGLRQGAYEQMLADQGAAQEDFTSPPLVDGAWNESSHVSNLIAKGFNISVDINKRGKAPRALDLSKPERADYVKEMLRAGVIRPGEPKFASDHFFLEKPGKRRLIFDGRKLNDAVKAPPKFTMKSHETIARLSAKYAWHAGEDLSNMFFSVKLNAECQDFFGLRTTLGNFGYTALPFGFSWAPFISHVIADQIVKRLLEEDIAATHYMDDFHVFGHSLKEVTKAAKRLRELLQDANWQINVKKRQDPAQVFVALGIEYDLINKTSTLPY
jgi:hypothetical protein